MRRYSGHEDEIHDLLISNKKKLQSSKSLRKILSIFRKAFKKSKNLNLVIFQKGEERLDCLYPGISHMSYLRGWNNRRPENYEELINDSLERGDFKNRDEIDHVEFFELCVDNLSEDLQNDHIRIFLNKLIIDHIKNHWDDFIKTFVAMLAHEKVHHGQDLDNIKAGKKFYETGSGGGREIESYKYLSDEGEIEAYITQMVSELLDRGFEVWEILDYMEINEGIEYMMKYSNILKYYYWTFWDKCRSLETFDYYVKVKQKKPDGTTKKEREYMIENAPKIKKLFIKYLHDYLKN